MSIFAFEIKCHYIMQTNFEKSKTLEGINKILSYLKSRKDITDLTYRITETGSKTLKYRIDYSFNWK